MSETAVIRAIESKRCPNSTDGGGRDANHYIREGACVICDRSTRYLSEFYGMD